MMTALLSADEAARLRVGVNLIVRPGDHAQSWSTVDGYESEFVAPQDWVALTGPCPTCDKRAQELHDAYEAAAAIEGWSTQERSRKPWADVPEANKRTMRAAIRQVFGCPDCRDGRKLTDFGDGVKAIVVSVEPEPDGRNWRITLEVPE